MAFEVSKREKSKKSIIARVEILKSSRKKFNLVEFRPQSKVVLVDVLRRRAEPIVLLSELSVLLDLSDGNIAYPFLSNSPFDMFNLALKDSFILLLIGILNSVSVIFIIRSLGFLLTSI